MLPDLLSISRWIVIIGYTTVIVYGVVTVRVAVLAGRKASALIMAVIGSVWVAFYLSTTFFFNPTSLEAVRAFTLWSRAAHLPTITGLMLMLFYIRESERHR
jgi:hypothetical protein